MPAIILESTTLADAAALYAIFCNPQNVQFTNFKTFDDLESFSLFLKRFLAIEKGSQLQYGPYSIYQNEKIIGLCGLRQINFAAGKSELWYLLHRDYWGKGLAKIAVQLLLAKAKMNQQLKIIYAETVGSNTASWRILESLGFVKNAEVENGFVKGDIVAILRRYTLNTGA